MTRATVKRASSGDVMAALAKRYAPPAWALLEQLANGTGSGANRWADAVAMSLWPSRGLHLHGFEIKVYRNDWLRELKRPEKADEIAAYCDFWWLVAGAGDVVDLARDPIPDTWGVLILDGRGLVQHREAVKNQKALPIDRSMLAAILRRSSERMVPKDAVQAQIDEALAKGEELGKREGERIAGDGHLRRELEDLQRKVKAFEAAAGITLEGRYGWDAEERGRAFKLALEINELRGGGALTNARNSLQHAIRSIDEALRCDIPARLLGPDPGVYGLAGMVEELQAQNPKAQIALENGQCVILRDPRPASPAVAANGSATS